MKKNPAYLNVIIITIFFLLSLIMLYPLWHCIVGSFMTREEIMNKTFLIWPDHISIESYRYIFTQKKILSPMRITVFVTLFGTWVDLFMVTFFAYGLSKKFPGSKGITYLVVFSMFFDPGLIANYMLFKNLKLLNSIAVYILPYCINTFYLIILRNSFLEFPSDLEESAQIEGANEFVCFFRIVLPLSTPVLATIALFSAVDYWNIYQQSVFFVTDSNLKTLQEYLYTLLSDNSNSSASSGVAGNILSENIKLANTVLSVLPILLVYPFLQRFFTNGIMVGAIKG